MASQLRALAQNPPEDPKERKELYEAARSLMQATRSEFEMRQELGLSMIPLTAASVAIDLKLFRTLAQDPEKQWHVDQLSKETRAEASILHRILRVSSSYGYVDEVSPATFQANSNTDWMCLPRGEANVRHTFLNLYKTMGALPQFLAKHKYQRTTDENGLVAFNLAFDTEESVFEYFYKHPEHGSAVFAYMSTHREGKENAFDGRIPLRDFELSKSDVEARRVLMVDVGGGGGHQCIKLRTEQPALKGKLVVQDLVSQIQQADAVRLLSQDIEPMVHDFCDPQPVKGAKVYYMRYILHDWSDDRCRPVLALLRDAMADDSVIAIDECILPPAGAPLYSAGFDTVMMTLGARERTRDEWQSLVASVGLTVKDAQVYDAEQALGMLVVAKA